MIIEREGLAVWKAVPISEGGDSVNEFRKVGQKLYDRRTGAHGKQVADLALFQISMPLTWSQITSQLRWRTCILVGGRTGRWSERILQPVHYSSHAGGVARRLTILQGR